MARTSEKRLLSLGVGPFRSGYDVLRILMAVVLLVAAGLKAHQLATEPVLGGGVLDSRWLLMATVEFELFFAFWLLSGSLPKQTWAAALACFGLFTCVSLYRALSGYATCGCFGRVPVNPWYTSTLDLAVVLSLLRWRPTTASPLPSGEGKGEGSSFQSFITHHSSLSIPRLVAVLLLWLAVGLPAAYAMGSYIDTTLSDAGVIVGSDDIVVLEPEKWVGKRFPLVGYIDVGGQLVNGQWTVVLYHHDCPNCQKVIRDYERRAKHLVGAPRVAIIEVPPYDDSSGGLISPGSGCLSGRLSDATEWFVETPVQLRLDRGIVRESGEQQRVALASRERGDH